MKTIDQYLKELPEPERTMCLEARAKAKKQSPAYSHDAQTAASIAGAIGRGFNWYDDGGDQDKFSAIYTRAKAGEFDTPDMEAMFTDIMDRLGALRMEQMEQDVSNRAMSETLNKVEGSVHSHGSAIATAIDRIVQRLTAIEDSVAESRTGATFMQEPEQEVRIGNDLGTTDAPIGLQPGDYTENAEGLEGELIVMGWPKETGRYRPYINYYAAEERLIHFDEFHSPHGSRKRTRLDSPTFLARARVTAQALGLKAVEPDNGERDEWPTRTTLLTMALALNDEDYQWLRKQMAKIPEQDAPDRAAKRLGLVAKDAEEPIKTGDWVRITEDPGNGSPYRWLDIVRVGSVDGEWAVIASDGPLPGSRSILRRKLEKLSKDEIAAQEQARVPKFGDRVECEGSEHTVVSHTEDSDGEWLLMEVIPEHGWRHGFAKRSEFRILDPNT